MPGINPFQSYDPGPCGLLMGKQKLLQNATRTLYVITINSALLAGKDASSTHCVNWSNMTSVYEEPDFFFGLIGPKIFIWTRTMGYPA